MAEPGGKAVRRHVARVLLVDERRRVLLFSGIDRMSDRPRWWFSVGGALEAGETSSAAAIRETFEETGLTIDDPGAVVLTRHVVFEFEGQAIDQEEEFFLVRVRSFEPEFNGWTEVERATMRGHRWWTIDELRTTSEIVYPEGLADLVDGQLR